MDVLIDGKSVAGQIREEIRKEVEELDIKPGLVVIMVGDDPASTVYVRNKEKACEKAGFFHKTYRLPSDTNESEIISLLNKLASDSKVHGIIVQLPLPKHISEENITCAIPVDKDVDCFHPINVGRLLTRKKGDEPLVVVPCTPAGIIELLDRYDISISGSSVAIVGRSNIVGKPLFLMMLSRDATVTMCHSKTKDLSGILKKSDIVVAAVGVAKMIKNDMLKDSCVVIDVGINRGEDGKLVGDVDFEGVKDKVHAITPVPGGVGPMTIAMLLRNTLEISKRAKKSE